jgi:LmbE family N-acetylglucosaminyl deacetylase
METLSETEFSLSTKEDSFAPNIFIDISKYMNKKIEIMNIYESEIGKHPFPRNERNIRA